MKLLDLVPWRRATDTSSNGAGEEKGVTFTPQLTAFEFPLGARKYPGSDVDYALATRNGMNSSVVTAVLDWFMRTFAEAPLVVQRLVEERWENASQHELATLLRKPNEQYSGRTLWDCTIMDFCFGEAYWLKVRNLGGRVVEFWWVPRTMIAPMPDQKSGRLSHYVYQPGYTTSLDLKPSDVVHFRFGQDPLNLLRGFPRLASCMREVYTDDQAANFTAAILKNFGVAGVVFSPETGTIPQDRLDKLKEDTQQKFSGDNRGKAMFFGNPMKAQLLNYQLSGFDVGPIRDIAEERVSAALGVPAAVIGFGTGLQQTKVGATMREMVKMAWQSGLEPVQKMLAAELDRSLLPEFQANTNLFRTHFDTSEVEALTETPAEKTDRVLKLTAGNIITIAQAQRELGYPVDSSQDKYVRELTSPPAVAQTPPTSANATPPANNNQPSGDANAAAN